MQYFIVFIEGVISFISPCHLPLIPIYLAYMAGDASKDLEKYRIVKNTIGFIVGFTLVYVALGAFAGTLGSFLLKYETQFHLITGIIVILFGLNFLGVLPQFHFAHHHSAKEPRKIRGFLSAVLLGTIFSIGWTPCTGVFLGSALMLAGQQGSAIEGILMLLCFSLGLGLPLLFCSLLIDNMTATFDFIKRHYHAVNIFSGVFLIVIGILMASGLFEFLLGLL